MVGRSAGLVAAAAIGLLSLECGAFVGVQRRPQHCTKLYASRSPNDEVCPASRIQKSIATFGTSAALFTAVLTSPFNVHINNPSHNNIIDASPIISIQRSQAYALTENEQFVADVWFAVSAQFFDQSFNGLGEDGWRMKEKEAISAVADTGPDDD